MPITVEEARAILGPEYAKVSDTDIKTMIDQLYKFCHIIIDWHDKHPGEDFLSKKSIAPESNLNKERHLSNKMLPKATLDQKIKRHIEHVAHCKCRPMPNNIKVEIQKRIGK